MYAHYKKLKKRDQQERGLAMKCLVCGNEVNHEEAFCGNCGSPNTLPTNKTPPSLQSTPLGNAPFTPPPLNTPDPGIQPAPLSRTPGIPPLSDRPMQTEFYRDATEAMSVASNNSAQRYPQQSIPSSSPLSGYPRSDQFGGSRQPPQEGTYTDSSNTFYGQQSPPTGLNYGYGTGGKVFPLQQTQSNNTVILVVCISVVVVLASVIAFSAIYITRTTSNSPAATTIPSPTIVPTPTAVPTNTPTPVPSPTAVPTPLPDAGFIWCSTTCTNNGFSTEYPSTWQPTTPTTATTQFTDPATPTISATFKTPPGTTTSAAGDLVTADLANFATQPAYSAPAPATTTTISGETWVINVATYQDATQQLIRISVYATVYQGKAYIIELQAPNDQYDALNQQSFLPMLNKFQFLQAAQ